MKGTRPKIRIKPTPVDIVLTGTAWVLFAIIAIYAISIYSMLPATVPSHFGIEGQPDATGKKELVIVLLGVQFFLIAFLTAIMRIPHTFNYPVVITGENAERQYSNVLRMLRWIQAITSAIFTYLLYMIVQVATGTTDGLGWFFFPILAVFISVPVLFAVWKSMQNK